MMRDREGFRPASRVITRNIELVVMRQDDGKNPAERAPQRAAKSPLPWQRASSSHRFLRG